MLMPKKVKHRRVMRGAERGMQPVVQVYRSDNLD